MGQSLPATPDSSPMGRVDAGERISSSDAVPNAVNRTF